MVITWMILSSVGITIARYMKPLLTDFVVLRKQLWFQVKNLFVFMTRANSQLMSSIIQYCAKDVFSVLA